MYVFSTKQLIQGEVDIFAQNWLCIAMEGNHCRSLCISSSHPPLLCYRFYRRGLYPANPIPEGQRPKGAARCYPLAHGWDRLPICKSSFAILPHYKALFRSATFFSHFSYLHIDYCSQIIQASLLLVRSTLQTLWVAPSDEVVSDFERSCLFEKRTVRREFTHSFFL